MKQIGLLSILPVFLVFSCRTGPQHTEADFAEPIVPVTAVADGGIPVPEEEEEEFVFDPVRITEERFASTMAELRDFIGELNAIIRNRDYEAWVGYLAPSYYAEINSEAFLAQRTEDLFRRDQIVASNMGRNPRQVQRRVLRTSRDFFYHIVVPSRSNDRLDDITFVSENRVMAFTIDQRGNRLVLYDLMLVGNRWQIIN